MKRALDVNTKILLSSNHQKISFIIDDIIGIGGSCIAYSVTFYENGDIPHSGVLKEYCPAFLTESLEFKRKENYIIIPPIFLYLCIK